MAKVTERSKTTTRTDSGKFETDRTERSDGSFTEKTYKETTPGVMGTEALRSTKKVSESSGKTTKK